MRCCSLKMLKMLKSAPHGLLPTFAALFTIDFTATLPECEDCAANCGGSPCARRLCRGRI